MTYYVGQLSSVELLGEGNPRFFYGLRRQDAGTNDGTLFFTKVDQLSSIDTITINVPGAYENNFESREMHVEILTSFISGPCTNTSFMTSLQHTATFIKPLSSL